MESGTNPATETSGHPLTQGGDIAGTSGSVAIVADDVYREREELGLLVVGFATGMTIAALFLVYIVLAYSGLLP